MYDNVTDLMRENPQGDHELIDALVEKEAFKRFSVRRALFRNVIFRNCQVRENFLFIKEGAVLENVTFENLHCRRMELDIRTVMKSVKLSERSKAHVLIVKYFDPLVKGDEFREARRNAVKARRFHPDESLDISEYRGEVEIAGFPSSRVTIDPERQIVIRSALKDEVDWAELGIPRASTWRSMAMRNPDCEDAVFSKPDPREPDYENHMAELEILRARGFVER